VAEFVYSLILTRPATGWTTQGSDPGGGGGGGGDFFPNRPDCPWGPPSHLNNGYRVFPARSVWSGPPTPSSTKVKEIIQLHILSLSGPSWPVVLCGLFLDITHLSLVPCNCFERLCRLPFVSDTLFVTFSFRRQICNYSVT
jgi:hypothetical protein